MTAVQPCCDAPSFSMDVDSEWYGDAPPRGPDYSKSVSTTTCSRCGWKNVTTSVTEAGKPTTMSSVETPGRPS